LENPQSKDEGLHEAEVFLMFDRYEEYYKNFADLMQWHESKKNSLNEATTRLQVIDRLLFECLAWHQGDVIAEDSYNGQYADYVLSAPRRILIIEAKREGDYFRIPVGIIQIERSIASLIKDNQSLKSALQQVSNYCQERGVPIGAIFNGHQVVAFIATRSDGIPPLEGRALVWPSFEFMREHFLDLWQCLSKPGIEEQYLQRRLLQDTSTEIPPKLSSTIVGYPGIKQRNIFQTDLQIMSEMVLEDIPNSREMETRFLVECYCKSGALSQYSVISKGILNARYHALFDSETPGPATLPIADKDGVSPEFLAESLSRRPILIIGDVGVGKTTFIRYLYKVDAADVLGDSIVLYIDLGSKATLAIDIKSYVLQELSDQLFNDYDIDIEERNFMRGVYHRDLERFSKGIYSDLIATDPNLYKQKEIEYLSAKVNNKEQNLRRALHHIVYGRKQQVVIFIDNADQRDYDTQQSAFLIAQELAEHSPTTVFVALRPETYHRSLKSGALSGYHPKAFTISPPRIDRVLQKRIEFALKITGGEIPVVPHVQLRLENLDSIIRVFLISIDRDKRLVQFIDNICGGNVRLALDLVRNFFGSGHVDTQKIIEIYETQGSYYIPIHEFARAVIYGDSEHYDSRRSPIANLYDVSHADSKEHFLMPIVLNFLVAEQNLGYKEGFVETERIYQFAQGLGFSPEQIDSTINRASRNSLIDSIARKKPELGDSMPQAFRITSVGGYLVTELCRFFSYFDAIIVDTPIFDIETRSKIENVVGIEDRLNRAELFLKYLNKMWEPLEKKSVHFRWTSVFDDLEIEIRHIRNRLQRNRN
jgi:GTPase SAR1 family protein